MKKILLLLCCKAIVLITYTQNVGIGTAAPNSSALLDLTSTSKGFLPPRMTTSQMYGIQNPVPGLLVFNTSYNELYQYNGVSWRSILNSNYWIRPIANRQVIGNAGDSVGIGLSLPTQRLDVNGNARFRNNVNVDAAVSATTLIASGNLVAAGDGTVSGTLQTNSELVINNASAIVQMRSSGVSKGYMQLSGDDVRIGTNVGNANGNLVVRMNGTERMRVDPEGEVQLTGNIKRSSVTGNHSLLPVAYGRSTRNGTLIGASSTDNVSVSRIAEGEYEITVNHSISNSIIVLTPIYEEYVLNGLDYASGPGLMFSRLVGVTANSTIIRVSSRYVDFVYQTNASHDNAFSFVIYGNTN